MKKACMFVTVTLLCMAASTALAIDLDDILSKHFETLGGLDKIKSVQTLKTTGVLMTQGMEIPFSTTHARPHKIRVDVTAMGMTIVQGYDGENAWSINPLTGATDPQKMEGLEAKGFKLQADYDGPLVDWKDKGYTVEFIGEDEIEGSSVYHIKIDTHEDIIIDMYLDQEYCLPLMSRAKMTIEENEIVQETYMSDYEETDGLVSARSTETRMNGVVTSQFVIKSMEYGMEVDESVFAMPE